MPVEGSGGVIVRRASPRDHLGVMRVLDGAMLDLSSETAQRRIDAGTIAVADYDNRIVGALVTVPREPGDDRGESPDERAGSEATREPGAYVEAIAVRRRRRGDGIGSALVEFALEEWTPLTADFDPDVKPFYESLGFDCEKQGERYRGVLD